MSNFPRVIICRSANDLPHMPGSIGGYSCEVCAKALVLTENGRKILRDHPASAILCNACGLAFAEVAETLGELERIEVNPEAKAQLDQGNKSKLAEWVRRRVS